MVALSQQEDLFDVINQERNMLPDWKYYIILMQQVISQFAWGLSANMLNSRCHRTPDCVCACLFALSSRRWLKNMESSKKINTDYVLATKCRLVSQNKYPNHIPTGMNVKSAILFSMVWMILSCPLLRNMPELVRTLKKKNIIIKNHFIR